MLATILRVHRGLSISRRFPLAPPGGEAVSVRELAALLFLGVCAALVSAFVKLNLGVPGHNIIRVIFPMALGLAMVPRRGSASIMGLSGLLAGGVFMLGGARSLGAGAMTSLVLTGLLLDLALLRARNGWQVYLRLTLAGVGANLIALLIRGGVKFVEGGLVTGLPLAVWFPKAIATYPLCGALAGLISAAAWFRFAADAPPGPHDEAAA
jgi:hypothetical protein